MTNYENFRKQMRNIGVYVALVPVAFGGLASVAIAQDVGKEVPIASSFNHNNPLDYNDDGHDDEVMAYATPQKDGSRKVRVVSVVSQQPVKTLDKMVLSDGTCLILANKKRKPAQIWDVYAKTFPCGDDSTRTLVGMYRNDGHGNFVKE